MEVLPNGIYHDLIHKADSIGSLHVTVMNTLTGCIMLTTRMTTGKSEHITMSNVFLPGQRIVNGVEGYELALMDKPEEQARRRGFLGGK